MMEILHLMNLVAYTIIYHQKHSVTIECQRYIVERAQAQAEVPLCVVIAVRTCRREGDSWLHTLHSF